MTKRFQFQLNLTYQECMAYYQGHYSAIQVIATNGQSIQFHAEHIRTYVTSNGVRGWFQLETTLQNKFVALKKL